MPAASGAWCQSRASNAAALAPRAARGGRLDDERGQALPFLLVWMVLALALIAMTLAVGQAASRRMGLQLLADAGAYTGASNMAVGMNALARINRELISLWAQSRPRFMNGVPCQVSDEGVLAYDQLARDLGLAYERLNARWYSQPASEARRVSTFNLYDLFPGERHRAFSLGETDRQAGLIRERDPDVLVRSTRDYLVLTWACTRGSWPEPRVHQFARHFRRAERRVTAFAWVVRAPAGAALLGPQFFGPLAVPAMGAAGVAKAVGGSIEDGHPTYVAKMIPLAAVGVRSVRDGVPRAKRPVTH